MSAEKGKVLIPPPPPPPPKSPADSSDGSWEKEPLTTYEMDSFMGFLGQVPAKQRAALLDKLASTVKGAGDTPSDDQTHEVKSVLFKTEAGQENNFRNTNVGASPARQLQTGLQISLVPRSERDFDTINVILRKNDRGADAIARKKTRDKIVKAMEPKLSANNISRIITSTDASSFDVAADALAWQSHLQTIQKFCVQYDMTLLFAGSDWSELLQT
jgi:hypothetical protein